MKGWIDRVLVSGKVYGGKRFYSQGGLKGKRALVSLTLGGQEHMFAADGVHGPMKDMLKHLLQGTLAYTGTLTLLSGGEQTLTALALIFAVFLANPAPICVLDEVDAPLDDANTERYANMVKRMSLQTQFIFISHSKITMEFAQQLVGVTMQEQGVSRVVEVDIEEALRLAEPAAA